MRRRRHSLGYVLYLHSPLWRLRRRLWILQAGGRCERCRSRKRLTIHHRSYRRLGHERRSDIAVLCWNCHLQQHHLSTGARHPKMTRPIRPAATLMRAALLITLAVALLRVAGHA